MRVASKVPRIPALVVIVAIACAGSSLWLTMRLTRENARLRSVLEQPSTLPGADGSDAPGAGATTSEVTAAELENARLRLRKAEAQAGQLAAELAIAPAEELKSLGRIEELAVDALKLVKTMEEVSEAMQASGRIPDETDHLTNDVPRWMVQTEAIGELEGNPAEIADLQARALRDLLGLDEGAAGKVRERLTAEFELLRARGLDRPHRPVEGQEEWYAGRDQMLLEAAARIEALIPASQRKSDAVGKIMNLGSCFRFGVPQAVDGNKRKLDFFYQEPGGKRIPL
jgi:hypothetical protein